MAQYEKKKRRKMRRKARKLRRKKFAESLQNNTPRSETWFYSLYKPYQSGMDEFNTVFADRIPDVINKRDKYIIEIDGSIHKLERIKKKDRLKTRRYESLGYTVIRIEAYNIESFNDGMKTLATLRGKNWSPVKIYTERQKKQLYQGDTMRADLGVETDI